VRTLPRNVFEIPADLVGDAGISAEVDGGGCVGVAFDCVQRDLLRVVVVQCAWNLTPSLFLALPHHNELLEL